jgi:hypothetical protein
VERGQHLSEHIGDFRMTAGVVLNLRSLAVFEALGKLIGNLP